MNSIRIAAALALGLAGAAQAEIRYRVARVERPGCFEPQFAVWPDTFNNLGQACGHLTPCSAYSFFWDPDVGDLIPLGPPPNCSEPSNQELMDMNDQGHVIGRSACTMVPEAYLWSMESGMIALGHLSSDDPATTAKAINNHDEVVGLSWLIDGSKSFLWTPTAGMVRLPDCEYCDPLDINDSTMIVGGASTLGAFVWTPQTGRVILYDLVGGDRIPPAAESVNNHGEIVGGWGGPKLFYIWDVDRGLRTYEGIWPSNYCGTQPVDLNDNGHVLAVTMDFYTLERYYIIWDERRGARDINTLIDPCVNPQSYSGKLVPNRLNNRGQIAAAPVVGYFGHVRILTPYIPGDVDEDEDCDLQDLAYLLANFGTESGATYTDGDLDCDQDVDLQDLAVLLSNFGETLP